MNALTIISIVFIVYVLYAVYRKEKRKKADLRFSIMYENLETILNSWPVTKVNQLKILSYFQDLRACRFKNVEKVQVLWGKFCELYKEIGKEHLKEADEFEVMDGDLDEARIQRFE